MPRTRHRSRRGVDNGEGCRHPQPTLESGERRCEFSQQGPGQSSDRKRIWLSSVSSRHIAGGNPPEILNYPEIFVGVNFWTSFRQFLPIHLFLILRAFVKNVTTRCDFWAQNTSKCVCGRGFAPDPTGEANRTPRLPSWFSGGRFAAGEGKRTGREGRRKREGVAIPHFFFYNLTTVQQCIVAARNTFARLSSSACV